MNNYNKKKIRLASWWKKSKKHWYYGMSISHTGGLITKRLTSDDLSRIYKSFVTEGIGTLESVRIVTSYSILKKLTKQEFSPIL